MSINIDNFNKLGFLVIRNIYDVKNHTILCPDLFEYTKSLLNLEYSTDHQTPGAPAFYKDLEMNKVQIKILSDIEKNIGLKLYPTYNYFRIYNSKSILKPHTDRPACEISCTINIGYEGDYNWPIWIKDSQGIDHKVILEKGDGLIYKGCENLHWREDADMKVKCQTQLFVHYVNRNGPYQDCIFDQVKL